MVVIAWVPISGTVAEAQTLTTVHDFCIDDTCATGAAPRSLIQAADGDFYGTATYGGANNNEICKGPHCNAAARGALSL